MPKSKKIPTATVFNPSIIGQIPQQIGQTYIKQIPPYEDEGIRFQRYYKNPIASDAYEIRPQTPFRLHVLFNTGTASAILNFLGKVGYITQINYSWNLTTVDNTVIAFYDLYANGAQHQESFNGAHIGHHTIQFSIPRPVKDLLTVAVLSMGMTAADEFIDVEIFGFYV